VKSEHLDSLNPYIHVYLAIFQDRLAWHLAIITWKRVRKSLLADWINE
jgi:hypothetical protein